MSKKKIKTRIEKEVTRHHLEHLTKNPAIRKSVEAVAENHSKKTSLSPQDKFIGKDLRSTLVIIGVFVLVVCALGLVFYKTNLFDSLLSHWNIKY